MTGMVRSERDGRVLRLTLNDEPTRNSLSMRMMADLSAALDEADRNVGAIVIASTGKVFSSGHNLKELTAHRADEDKGLAFFGETFGACAKLMTKISQHRCAIIAEVDGLASAAGCQLVAASDLAYASPQAGFCTPGVSIGLFCSTPMVPLSRTIAPKHALEMLLTGDVIKAEKAERIGLINGVVSQNELRTHVSDLAARIAAKSQTAIGIGKRSFHDQMPLGLPDAYAMMAAIMAKNMMDGAACEGIDAFIAKRHPVWPQ
jgi:enoyl-CoA hydratase/carnithine racemase